jgi:hypothetical protein
MELLLLVLFLVMGHLQHAFHRVQRNFLLYSSEEGNEAEMIERYSWVASNAFE